MKTKSIGIALTLALVLTVFVDLSEAIGLGTVTSVVGKLFTVVSFIQGFASTDKPLKNFRTEDWSQSYLQIINYSQDNVLAGYYFLVPEAKAFDNTDSRSFITQAYTTIATASDYGLTFDKLMGALDKMSTIKTGNTFMVSATTIEGPVVKRPYLCGKIARMYCAKTKQVFVTIGPEKNYLMKTSDIQGWNDANVAAFAQCEKEVGKCT